MNDNFSFVVAEIIYPFYIQFVFLSQCRCLCVPAFFFDYQEQEHAGPPAHVVEFSETI